MSALHARAVSELGARNFVALAGKRIRLASLVREEDMRPLPRGVRQGKQASLLAVDCSGNFIVRDAGGSVILVDRLSGDETTLASSVSRFLTAIEEEPS